MAEGKLRYREPKAKDVAEFVWCGFALLTDVECLRGRYGNAMSGEDPMKYKMCDPDPYRQWYAEVRERKGASSASTCLEYATYLLSHGPEILRIVNENVRLAKGIRDVQAVSLCLMIGSSVGFFGWYLDRPEKMVEVIQRETKGAYAMDFIRAARETDRKILNNIV